MVRHSPNVHALILQIHSRALAPDGWDEVVSDLCRAVKATGASLVRPSHSAHIKPSATLYEFDAAAIKSYAEYWGQHDIWYIGAVRNGRVRVGRVNQDHELIDRREFEQSPFFNEYLRPLNIDRMMNVCLTEPDGGYGPVAMSLYRGLGAEPFSIEDAGLLSQVAPHLTIAAQNHFAAQALRLLTEAYQNAVDAVSSAVFGIESSGHITFVNRAGEELIRLKRWVRQADGALVPSKGVLETAGLAKALHQLSIGLSFKLIATDVLSGAKAIVSGAPTASNEVRPHQTKCSALVWVTPVVPTADVSADVAQLFGLTHAERRLVGRLIEGQDLREAAVSLNISLHTARTQLKAVFSKSGLRTQAALLSFAARLAALRASSNGHSYQS
jgi:DNA-binding CsgD family transcriptional regulator/PAS domain-containing protein